MGRLLRKRKAVKKKKQNDNNVQSSLVNQEPGHVEKKVPVSDNSQKRTVLAKRKVQTPGKDGYIEKTLQYLREVKAELKKVTWPSRKQTVGSTFVVIVLVMIISVFLGIVDMSLSGLIRIVLQ